MKLNRVTIIAAGVVLITSLTLGAIYALSPAINLLYRSPASIQEFQPYVWLEPDQWQIRGFGLYLTVGKNPQIGRGVLPAYQPTAPTAPGGD